MHRRALSLLAATTATVLCTIGTTITPSAEAASTVPVIDWSRPCPAIGYYAGLECGRMEAPLDYSNPAGETTTVFMSRLKATGDKRGTIFTNPGGPGSPGSPYVMGFAAELGEGVTRHYDIVGTDPRGTTLDFNAFGVDPAGAEGVDIFTCGMTPAPATRIPFFDVKPGDANRILRDNESFRSTCAQANPRIARFMSTADTARDINLARLSLGEEKIDYYGISYGSYLAATLVNLFPNDIRTAVSLSSIDPRQWTRGYGLDGLRDPAFARIGSAHGSARQWEAAFTACEEAGPERCAAANTVREDWELLHRLGPGHVWREGETEVSYDIVANMLTGLGYSRGGMETAPDVVTSLVEELREPETRRKSTGTGALSKLKEAVEKHGQDPLLSGPRASLLSELPSHGLPWLMQPILGVMCGESVNPFDPTTVMSTSARLNDVLPGEGKLRAWQGAACTNWPLKAKNPYMGPFNRPTANGVLIVNNEYDPATPLIEGAQKLRSTLPGSRLVTIKGGYGHGPMSESECAADAVRHYILTAELPSEDVTCTAAPLFGEQQG